MNNSLSTNLGFWQNATKYGLLYAAFSIALTLIFYIFNISTTDTAVSLTSSVLIIIIMIYIFMTAAKKYRDYGLEGKINFGKAFSHTIAACVIGGAVIALFYYVFYTYIAPDYLAQQAEATIEMMESYGLPEDILEQSVQRLETQMQPLAMVRNTSIGNLVMGIIVGLFVGLIIKKDNTHSQIKE